MIDEIIVFLLLFVASLTFLQEYLSVEIFKIKNPPIYLNLLYACLLFGIFILVKNFFPKKKTQKTSENFFFQVSPVKECNCKDKDGKLCECTYGRIGKDGKIVRDPNDVPYADVNRIIN